MATYVERTNASGSKKIKAIARCWVKGKQVNKTKSFNIEDRDQAIHWAESMEEKMKHSKIGLAQRELGRKSGDDVKPFGKIIDQRVIALQRMRKALSIHVTPATLNTHALIGYFRRRSEQSVTLEEIAEEKKALKSLIVEFCGGESRRGNIVEVAFEAALCEGAFFK